MEGVHTVERQIKEWLTKIVGNALLPAITWGKEKKRGRFKNPSQFIWIFRLVSKYCEIWTRVRQ